MTETLSRRPAIQVAPRRAVDLEVLIPAFNEERRIGTTVRAICDYLARQAYSSALVVIDNGSVDRTVDVVRDLARSSPVDVQVINCGRAGKGAAVRSGVLSSSARYVGFCDADLATPIETLDAVWPLLREGVEVAIGSRKVAGAGYLEAQPLRRRLGSLAFQVLARRIVPGVRDTQCGFKFFPRPVAQELFASMTIDRFAFDVELLALASRQGLAIREVPVQWSDRDGSTFRALPDGLVAVAEALRAHIHMERRPRPAARRAARA